MQLLISQAAMALFRLIGALCRTPVVGNSFGSLVLVIVFGASS
jgi:hypothetical protein